MPDLIRSPTVETWCQNRTLTLAQVNFRDVWGVLVRIFGEGKIKAVVTGGFFLFRIQILE